MRLSLRQTQIEKENYKLGSFRMHYDNEYLVRKYGS